MKESMYSGVHARTGNVIFCVRGDKVTQSTNNGPTDPWRTPAGFIGFTYWPCSDYVAEDYSDVTLVWEREV